MKNIIILLLLPILCQAQRIDTAYVIHVDDRFILHSEISYEDGRKVVEDTPMDSVKLALTFARDVYSVASKVSTAAITVLERRDVVANSIAKRDKIKLITGADILDMIGAQVMKIMEPLSWEMRVDTTIYPASFSLTNGKPTVTVNGNTLDIYCYNESWFRVLNFYGNGRDEDFFLFRGVYVNLGYNIIFAAINKIKQEKAATVKRRGNK